MADRAQACSLLAWFGIRTISRGTLRARRAICFRSRKKGLVVLSKPVLVGRSDPLAQATLALRRAAQRSASTTMWVTGEAGIGKSVFVDAVMEQATRMGYGIGLGKADEIGQIAPGAPLLLALRSGRPPLLDAAGFGRVLAVQQNPLVLVERIADLLEERLVHCPVLLAVDDYQWADRLTRFCLRVLIDRLIGLPVVWLLAARISASGGHELDLPRSASSTVSSIPLAPLGDADILSIATQILGSAPGDGVQNRLRGASGNPMVAVQFLTGILKSPDDTGVPPTFLAAIRTRLRALERLTRSVVQVAAVWGQPFTTSDVIGVLRPESAHAIVDSIDLAVTAGLITRQGELLAMAHDLVREAVYVDIPASVRARLHRRCAEYLVATGHDALTAAPHLLASARPGDTAAVLLLRTAAIRSVGPLPVTAVELITTAFALLPQEHPLRMTIGEECAEILSLAQRSREAVDLVDLLLAVTADPEGRARLEVIAARALWLAGSPSRIVQRVDAALAGTGVSAVTATRLLAFKALAHTRTGSAVTAAVAANLVLEDARRLGDPPAEQVALQALGEIARNEQHHARAFTYFRTLRTTAGPNYVGYEVAALRLLDRFGDADRAIVAATRDVEGDQSTSLPAVLEARMWQDFMLGRFDDACAEAITLSRLSRDLDVSIFELETAMVLMLTAIVRGDLAEASRRLRAARSDDRADRIVRMPRLDLIGSLLAGIAGNPTTAVRIVKPVMTQAAELNSYWPRLPEWVRVHVGLALAAGDMGFARDTVIRATLAASRNPGVASLEGLALQVQGLVDRDDELLAAAVGRLEASPRPMLLASALLDHGTALLQLGRRDEAAGQLRRAWSMYDTLGAVLPAHHTAAVLTNAGLPALGRSGSAKRPTTGWAALTEAERRVAALISSGQSNRLAARQLEISTNTLATHLRSVFLKLDVRSRVQLANRWHAHTASSPREVQ